jgi:hypothetical protein
LTTAPDGFGVSEIISRDRTIPYMKEMPAVAQPILRRLARRLAVGLFLDRWPAWAAVSLLAAGGVVLVCRMFFPGAASSLHWLWLAPLLTAIPVLIVCVARAYRPEQVVAVADWLGGGHGSLLTLLEHPDPAWADSAVIERASRFALPRLRPWRKLALVPPAAAFLAVAFLLPQRLPAAGSSAALADDIAADLTATVVALKQEQLITPADEEKLEEQIERIRRDAEKRVDASAWEAADALREQVVADLSAKQDAVKWAEQSLSRLAAAAQAGGAGDSRAAAHAAELSKALEKLAQSGMLGSLSPELQALLKQAALGKGTGSLDKLTAALAEQLAAANSKMAGLAALGKEFGRFNPAEFPLEGRSQDGDGNPGRGGVNRGRGDAPLTYGKESQPVDRFKAEPLPPGAARSPDDWAPIVTLPGTPQESARLSRQAQAREYAAAAGQAAWRRSLAPRHQTAVKKYFGK